jgi:hypothetical protein
MAAAFCCICPQRESEPQRTPQLAGFRLHGRTHCLPDCGGRARSRRRGGFIPRRRPGYRHAEQSTSSGRETKAQLLIAIAANDDQRAPNEKTVLKDTFAKANLPAEIEVYTGAHGWCPPDSQVYNEQQAEKAWSRLLALYQKALV